MKRLTSVLALLVLALAVRDGSRRATSGTTRGPGAAPPAPATRTSAAGRGPRHTSSWAAVAVAAAAVLVLTPVSGTFAGFSASETSADHDLAAGTLQLAGGGDLEVTVDDRGGSEGDTLQVTNNGSTPAALQLQLDPTGGDTCDGYDEDAHDGELLLFLDGVDEDDVPVTVEAGDLCEVPSTLAWPGDIELGQGESSTIGLRVELADDALFRWSDTSIEFDLTVSGHQASPSVGPGDGFSDSVTGTFTVHIDDYTPAGTPPPPECLGIGEYRIVIPNGSGDIDLSNETGPAYIRVMNGEHTITGTDQNDCIVVGNGKMTVYGGDGDDVIISQHPNSTNAAGGKASLYGQGGDDTLIARNGATILHGGSGTNTCKLNGVEVACETDEVEASSLSEPAPRVLVQRTAGPEEPEETVPPPAPAREPEHVPAPAPEEPELDDPGTEPETDPGDGADPGTDADAGGSPPVTDGEDAD